MTVPEIDVAKTHKYLPKYEKYMTPEVFFKILEYATEGWTDKQKLDNLFRCFSGKRLVWYGEREFDSWEDFKTKFTDEETVELQDEVYYMNKLMRTKRKNFRSYQKYVRKFDSLCNQRDLCLNDISSGSGGTSATKSNKNKYLITLFTNNSLPANLRRYLDKNKPETLSAAYKLTKRYHKYDQVDSSDDDSSNSESDNNSNDDSSGESKDESYRKKKKSAKKGNITAVGFPKKLKKMSDIGNALMYVMEQNKELLKEKQKWQSKNNDTTTDNRVCYNYDEPRHIVRDCAKPCPICNRNDHKRLNCPDRNYNNNNGNNNNGNGNNGNNNGGKYNNGNNKQQQQQQQQHYNNNNNYRSNDNSNSSKNATNESRSSNLLITVPEQAYDNHSSDLKEEVNDFLMVKRTRNEAEGSQPKDKQRKDRKIANDMEIEKEDVPMLVAPENQHKNDKSIRSKKVLTPESVIKELRHQKVYRMSYDDILTTSNVAHQQFKNDIPFTPEHTVRNTIANGQQQSSSTTSLYSAHDQSKGEKKEDDGGAPKVKGMINKHSVSIILDTGCTPCTYHQFGIRLWIRIATCNSTT